MINLFKFFVIPRTIFENKNFKYPTRVPIRPIMLLLFPQKSPELLRGFYGFYTVAPSIGDPFIELHVV